MTAIHAVGVDEPASDPADDPDAALAAVLRAPQRDRPPDGGDPGEGLVLDAFLRPHLYGLHPYLVEQVLPGAVRVLDVLPPDATVLRMHRRNQMIEVLASCKGSLLVVRSWKRMAECWASGADRDVVEDLVKEIKAKVPVVTRERSIRTTFWQMGRNCPSQWSRIVAVPRWADIAHLYPATVRSALEQLMAYRATDASAGGRLVLWHGPPGTGKTTAVRALMDAWRGWAAPHVVADAEKLLNESNYLSQVLIDGDDDEEDVAMPWRLVIVEDAAELLRHDSRARVGSALGRLLNTADGLLGQGSKALVLLTTNEPIGEMHPALLRPGRCLARVEFPPFSPSEASTLLGADVQAPTTLAEVMERRGELHRMNAVVIPTSRTGNYL